MAGVVWNVPVTAALAMNRERVIPKKSDKEQNAIEEAKKELASQWAD